MSLPSSNVLKPHWPQLLWPKSTHLLALVRYLMGQSKQRGHSSENRTQQALPGWGQQSHSNFLCGWASGRMVVTWLSCSWFSLTWPLRLTRAKRVLCGHLGKSLLGIVSSFHSITSTKAYMSTNSPMGHIEFSLECGYHLSVALFQRHLRVG